VASLQQRLDALQVRLADAEQRQSAYLVKIAVQELEQQKDRLATYQVQARFALATMYDRAATAAAAHNSSPSPTQKEADPDPKAAAPLQDPPPAPAPEPPR
jgi:hypothetical protein